MTCDEAISAVRDFVEARAKKLPLGIWCDLEIQRIVNSRRWWWRRKNFTFTLVPGTQVYDLSDPAGADATDFLEMIDLQLRLSNADISLIFRQVSPDETQKILTGEGTAADPTSYIIEPGTTKSIRFNVPPVSPFVVSGLYWASFDPEELGADTSQQIPLIPRAFHYVVVLRLLARTAFFLFGQAGDPRVQGAAADAEMAMGELRAFKGPSSTETVDFIAHNDINTVSSTR